MGGENCSYRASFFCKQRSIYCGGVFPLGALFDVFFAFFVLVFLCDDVVGLEFLCTVDVLLSPRVTESVFPRLPEELVVLVWPVLVDGVVGVEPVWARHMAAKLSEPAAINAINLCLMFFLRSWMKLLKNGNYLQSTPGGRQMVILSKNTGKHLRQYLSSGKYRARDR